MTPQFAPLMLIIIINLASSKFLYTYIDGDEHCLSRGYSQSSNMGLFIISIIDEGDSLDDGEVNLFWCRNNDQNCPCTTFQYSNGEFYAYISDESKTYYMEWDGDKGDGNEIRSNERNLKIDSDTTSGDSFYTYNGSYCSDANGDRCCMEWDGDQELFREHCESCVKVGIFGGGGSYYGREAKVDCDGGRDSVEFK
mmetsp:Transcript_69456/g.62309  ORF Transcript_69456/g.62309 Transcript_69456/m.62309 type:complete len:196 (+) Transcript_69456:70-657(+)